MFNFPLCRLILWLCVMICFRVAFCSAFVYLAVYIHILYLFRTKVSQLSARLFREKALRT